MAQKILTLKFKSFDEGANIKVKLALIQQYTRLHQ